MILSDFGGEVWEIQEIQEVREVQRDLGGSVGDCLNQEIGLNFQWSTVPQGFELRFLRSHSGTDFSLNF